MKKILFFMILLCPIVLGGCSSDDDDWMDLDSKHLVGTWSTGTEGTHKYLTYIIHSGFISGYQNRYGDNLKPPTNVYHRMTA